MGKSHFYTIQGEDITPGDFNMTKRIRSAYRRAGKVLGYYLRKEAR